MYRMHQSLICSLKSHFPSTPTPEWSFQQKKSLTYQDEEWVKKVKLDQLLHLSDKGVFGVVHGVNVYTERSAGDDVHAVASKDAEDRWKRQAVLKYLDQVNVFFPNAYVTLKYKFS